MFRSKLLFPGVALALACGAFAQTGTTFCAATANSTGSPSSLTGSFGSGVGSDLHLEVTGGVPNEFGYFLAGNEVTSGMALSGGLLCLTGTPTAQLYRYNAFGTDAFSIGRFDAAGVLQNLSGTSLVGTGFDVPSMIPASVPFTILSGDTWHFQLWHRDTPVMAGSSNFSNGLSVTFDYSPVPIAGMVLIPAGAFSMGSDAGGGPPYNGNSNTQPLHDVTISQDFWMGEHEVTQAEYSALIGSNPSYFSGVNLPVEQVSWDDAVAYCTALTAQEMVFGNLPAGYEYRLPTEAEWEYACRAGTTTEFNVGADLYCANANFWYSYHSNSSCGTSTTIDVGNYPANAFGLYDMHGNVAEWSLDSWSYYSAGAVADPFVAGGSFRVARGGSWGGYSNHCRSAYRGVYDPGFSTQSIGFRVVLSSVLVP